MLLHVYSYFNKAANCFQAPFAQTDTPEIVKTNIERSVRYLIISNSNYEQLLQYKNSILYHVGDFDDETGNLINFAEPSLLLNFVDLIPNQNEVSA